MKKRKLTIIVFGFLLGVLFSPSQAQINNPYQAYFDEAYSLFPNIPEGVLESVAYNNTRMHHLEIDPEDRSCQGIPKYLGVMGLIEDGKGYFNNTLEVVSRNSQFSPEEIKSDPRANILAYAEAYANRLRARSRFNVNMINKRVEQQGPVLGDLSEIPNDNSELNRYARDQQFYSVLKEMENPHTGRRPSANQRFDYRQIFGQSQFTRLTQPTVQINVDRRRNQANQLNSSPFRCTSEDRQADFMGAVWQAANTRNYGSRSGESIEYITIHTIQGTYASAISWFKNPNARVSTHYVIRSSDGQVTQMVCESDKAFHVKTDNATSIGIEHEGYIADGASWYTDAMYESSARLVRDLAQRHGINTELMYSGPGTDGIRTLSNTCYRIKGHQHFRNNNHIDPGPHWDWDRYYNLINAAPEVETLSKASGRIQLLNYDSGLRKAYLIDPPGNNPIQLKFLSFDLEGSQKEPFDFIDLYDGANTQGRPLGRFSGNRVPEEMVANSGKVYIEFRSDCRANARGFDLAYSTGNINVDCFPLASAKAKQVFALSANLSWSSAGKGQYVVKVRKKDSEEPWSQFQTRNNFFQLSGLAANSSYEWEVHSICANDKISAPVGGNFTTTGVSRSGKPEVYILTESKGVFMDSGGERNYSNREAFIYSIRPREEGRIRVTFSDFDLEEGFDFLTVYDGPDTQSNISSRYSGNDIPNIIESNGNSLTFKFVSDNRKQGRGWKASWEQLGKDEGAGEDPGGPGPITTPGKVALNPDLKFPSSPNRLAEVTAELKGSYTGPTIPIQFVDKSKTGRNPSYRFYAVVQQEGSTWEAQPNRGFFWEEFSESLGRNWQEVKGDWRVENNQLVQADARENNSNIWAPFKQDKSQTYLYHWVAQMEGAENNKRMGLHFFISDPDKEQRGNSYFVWFRDSDSGDKAEIYKTTNNSFKLKMDKSIQLESGKAYDFKVIYRPANGRIEVYIDNVFILSWRDRSPLRSGKAISFRTGGTQCVFDDLRVYKGRGSNVDLKVGKKGSGDIVVKSIGKSGQRFRVFTAIVDPANKESARWSKVVHLESRVISPSNERPPVEEPSNTSGIKLNRYYQGDIPVTLPAKGYFMLPIAYDLKNWNAETDLGYFYDEFRGNKFNNEWEAVIGRWNQNGGRLIQEDESATNANMATVLNQGASDFDVYLYHFRAKLLTSGDNKRFGFHFFSSDGLQSNRGDSYLVWFRNYASKQDLVEVYKSGDNALNEPLAKAPVDLSTDTWYDCKIVFDTRVGIVWVFLNDQQVLTWQDRSTPLQKGTYISLRTGSAQVEFDDMRVYKQLVSQNATITVGANYPKMIRFSKGTKTRSVNLYFLRMNDAGTWEPEILGETKIR